MKKMHSSRIVVQALPAPGAPDYWDTEKSKKSGTKLRKLNSNASFSRGKYNKDVDDFIPRQSERIRNKQNRRINALCLGAPARIMNQENNSHILSSDNMKSSTQVRSCIQDLSAWKVKKKRSILNSKSNSLENNVITCEQENAASVDEGRTSEMGVNTCYEGDLVISSSEIGACPPKNTCDGVEETSRKNPSKSGTDCDLETCSDRCNDISKGHIFVTSESKSVSEVENRNEAVPNVDNSMTSESGVNNAAIERRGLRIYPRLEMLITYSRKRRKNSSAPASSLPFITTNATSSFPITENKTTTSSDRYQVSISYSNNLPEEVTAGGGTLLMGVQQMLLEKAAGDSSCSETWNKKETIQDDNQKGNINSSVASIKDESPINSKTESSEQEKRNETDAVVNMSYDIEFAKESSRYAMPCDLRASSDTHCIITTNEPLNGERQSATEDSPSQSRASGFVAEKSQITNVGIIPPLGRALNAHSSKKLLVLDVNGLLADIVPLRYVPYSLEASIIVSGKAVFKRPFHDDFLQFCFERFHVGVWSSRIKRNMELVLDFLLGDAKQKLLFCWDQSHCTDTGFPVVGKRRSKPIILKKLKKLWDNYEPDLPWERGEFDESNTLLLDDSPHKALCNPPNTAIFPNSYHYMDEKDDSLAGPGGDLRVYLEGLSMAENVQKYVESNPFGQRPITEKNASWRYYRKVIAADAYLQESRANKFSTYKCRH
ncbi:uncharacterized protein LOC132052361 isoform X1 [Lycium ferocissimum]|uniref:uncharacterized protein LOC132052361 isoform X1 n=1 Tax=Lycium ferocissimum TaxID=112874 RepID=UPI00281537D1|nr:uncharacterized protein LOC132052361 isoform X1 [Lycium ferocissimum]